jgi:magnesium-transporting ATPase (P-type)
MLWVAGILAILAGMPQLGFAIFVVIVLNAVFAFLQEYRAEKAADRLRHLLPRRAIVIRDGRRQSIDAIQLVPDDVLVLSAGDGVSADVRLSQAHSFAVDTSTLTGESVPVRPEPGEVVFAGTFAVEGEATAVVVATGRSSRLAQIAEMSSAGRRPPSPLALELNRVVRVIAWATLAVGSAFLIVALLVGIRVTDAFLFALGVTVALVPEGLLPTVSLSLAIGAQRMAARGALVRRLESVETLGSTTFICTDKTGTLTRNEMSVAEVWMPQGHASIEGIGYDATAVIRAHPDLLSLLTELATAGAVHLTGRAVLREGRWVAEGNPLDAALDVFARRLKVDLRPKRQRLPNSPVGIPLTLGGGECQSSPPIERS